MTPTNSGTGGNSGTSGTGSSGTTGSTASSNITAPVIPGPNTSPSTVATSATSNFTSATPPPLGTVFSFSQAVVTYSSSGSADANAPAGTFSVTVKSSSNLPQLIMTGELKVPGISLDVQQMGISANGLPAKLIISSSGIPQGGGLFDAGFAGLNYTLMGGWNYEPTGSGTTYFGYSVGGYQTPASGTPSSGSATYTGIADARIFVPGPLVPMISTTQVSGNASVAVNFSSGAVTGTLSNMAIPSNFPAFWNDVSLTGCALSGGAISGTTSTTTAPSSAGMYAFSSNATGKFSGALYGPSGQELGAIWSLYDPSGKSAVGGLVAKQP